MAVTWLIEVQKVQKLIGHHIWGNSSLGTIQKGRPRSGGGGGQPKVDELGQGEGGSGQSGHPFYLMWQG